MAAENLIILGSGPAGLTAAIYAARANLNPLVVEGDQPGGQLTITSDVENYPGFPAGIMGPELMTEFRKQAERFGTRFAIGDVKSVDLSGPMFKMHTEKQTFETRTMIISTGASANLLGLTNESRLMGKGVSTCATCDGFFFRGLEIAVIGGGDSACEEANFLTKFASKVTMIHRRDEFRASKIMADRVLKNPKIEVVWDTGLEDVLGDRRRHRHSSQKSQNGQTRELNLAGVFVAIGHSPNTKLFKGKLEMDASGYLITREGTKTSIPGVFAAGDVQDHVYRQAITAAGSGCMAAIDAERSLESHHLRELSSRTGPNIPGWNEQIEVRYEKTKGMRAAGINPYRNGLTPTPHDGRHPSRVRRGRQRKARRAGVRRSPRLGRRTRDGDPRFRQGRLHPAFRTARGSIQIFLSKDQLASVLRALQNLDRSRRHHFHRRKTCFAREPTS